jgi:2,4-dienoyl-CoA reductase-like NADH-dependent reductase (Old Yellow Enzyme family)
MNSLISSKLFTPIHFRSVECRNRIFVSPMCQYSAKDGRADDWHLVHLGARAIGGAGLVMVEATAVEPDGRISPFDLGLWTNEQADALMPIACFIRAQGAVAAIQLAHSGRKGSTTRPWDGGGVLSPDQGGWIPCAPSAVSFGDRHPVPIEMSESDMVRVRDAFVEATRRARRAQFQVVEVHAAHGYLLNEFLSPLANSRSDRFGGEFANRIRFPLSVIAAVREEWPKDQPLFVRLSATDWVEGGWSIEETIQLSRLLKDIGVDLIDCSTGGIVPHAKIPVAPGFQVEFAERVRQEVGIATGAVGLITEPKQAEAIVAQGRADAVFIAREFLRDPHWPLKAARELGAKISWPQPYERARV